VVLQNIWRYRRGVALNNVVITGFHCTLQVNSVADGKISGDTPSNSSRHTVWEALF